MFDTGTDGTVATLQNGSVTAGHGLPGRPLPLFPALRAEPTSRTATVTALITNNAAGGPVRLVYNGSDFTNNLLTFNGANTYTGGTVINAGMLVLGAGGTLPAAGSRSMVRRPTAATRADADGRRHHRRAAGHAQRRGLPDPGQQPSLTSITINNNGGTTAPTVSGGTLCCRANGITATSNNVSTTSLISSMARFRRRCPYALGLPGHGQRPVRAPLAGDVEHFGRDPERRQPDLERRRQPAAQRPEHF